MSVNEARYGWFVRLARGPIGPVTIRDIHSRRVTVQPDEFVFGQFDYLHGMDGFVYIPNFDRKNLRPELVKYIRVDQPAGFEDYIDPATLADFDELNVIEMNTEDFVDDVEVEEEVSVEDAVEDDEVTEVFTETEEQNETPSELNKEVLLEYDGMPNREWFKMKKAEAKQILTDAGVDFSGVPDSKWDLVKLIKKLIKELKD